MPEKPVGFAWSTPPLTPGDPAHLLPVRVGRFLVSLDLIEQSPDDVRQLLDGVLVVRAEALFFPRAIEYCGLCDAFDEIEPGPDVPLYQPSIAQAPGADTWTVTWERQ